MHNMLYLLVENIIYANDDPHVAECKKEVKKAPTLHLM